MRDRHLGWNTRPEAGTLLSASGFHFLQLVFVERDESKKKASQLRYLLQLLNADAMNHYLAGGTFLSHDRFLLWDRKRKRDKNITLAVCSGSLMVLRASWPAGPRIF